MMPFSRIEEGARCWDEPLPDDLDLFSCSPLADRVSGLDFSAFSCVPDSSRDSFLGLPWTLSPSPLCSILEPSEFVFSSVSFGLESTTFLEWPLALDWLRRINLIPYSF